MKHHDVGMLAAALSTLLASAALAQSGQSSSTTTTGAAAGSATNSSAPATPVFNPNSNPNPVTGAVGNPPSPVTGTAANPAGNPATNPAGPPAANPAGSPATPPGSAAISNAVTAQNGVNASATQTFLSLDPAHKGYLSTADVASNRFLSGNFRRCDTNADGRLTQAEVTLCMQSAPPGQQ